MTRSIVVAVSCFFFALPSPRASADDAKKMPPGAEKLLRAISRGDFAAVKRIAATSDLKQVPDLHAHALRSPNADVVEFLRDPDRPYKISDVQIAAIRGDATAMGNLLRRLDRKARDTCLMDGLVSPFYSNSPLLLAVRNGHTDVVSKMIEFGANVNEATYYSLTPLAIAAELGHVDIVKRLLKSGAKINLAPDGYTALMRACLAKQPQTSGVLLRAGADANQKRQDGRRALHFAAQSGNAECVTLLLRHGAHINAVDDANYTALAYAESRMHKAILKVLRETKPD